MQRTAEVKRGARKTREWTTRHEMTWKCGRLMLQLNFRECVDGRSFMYTLNRQGDKTETISLESPGAAFVSNVHAEASISEK